VRFTWAGSSITHKHYTRLEEIVRNKHSSLLQKNVNYGVKSLFTLAQRAFPWRRPALGTSLRHNKLECLSSAITFSSVWLALIRRLTLDWETWKVLPLCNPALPTNNSWKSFWLIPKNHNVGDEEKRFTRIRPDGWRRRSTGGIVMVVVSTSGEVCSKFRLNKLVLVVVLVFVHGLLLLDLRLLPLLLLLREM